MSIYFERTWDNQHNPVNSLGGQICSNHTSQRSEDEVRRIVEEAGISNPDTPIGRALQTNASVKIIKGIHPDTSSIFHITVKCQGQLHHINLKKNYDPYTENESRTFVWNPA